MFPRNVYYVITRVFHLLSHCSFNAIFFHDCFYYINFVNFLLWCPMLQSNLLQLIPTLIKNYYYCADCYLNIININIIRLLFYNVYQRLERLLLLNLCHYCCFIFHHYFTALELMVAANERACYYNYY